MPKKFPHFQAGARLLADALTPGISVARVPVYAQLHEFAMQQLGVSARAFYSTPELLIDGVLEITAEYGIDVPFTDYDVYNIEAEAIGQYIIWSDETVPDCDRGQPLIQSPSDLAKIRTPDFATAGRCPMIIEAKQRFLAATGLQPTVDFSAPFSFVANIRGIENLILDILLRPDFAHELFSRAVHEVLGPWIRTQQAHFPQATDLVGSDATASLPIVSPDMLRDWVLPTIDELRDLCGPGIHVPNWGGESLLTDPTAMLDMKLHVAGNAIKGQDPDVARLGPQVYLQYAREHDASLLLGIGATFLDTSTPEEVVARVRHYLEVGMQHDRFALFFCNLSANTPPANVRAAVEAIHTFGVYEYKKQAGRHTA
ncbi:MAG: hypothetical protein GXP37_02010 [Chloroflexi bacterium]|nr:hypothetical protein [Chloroflexota bacterium]